MFLNKGTVGKESTKNNRMVSDKEESTNLK